MNVDPFANIRLAQSAAIIIIYIGARKIHSIAYGRARCARGFRQRLALVRSWLMLMRAADLAAAAPPETRDTADAHFRKNRRRTFG
ncbi:unnamed protein product, partial [Iphiclides podalirius]